MYGYSGEVPCLMVTGIRVDVLLVTSETMRHYITQAWKNPNCEGNIFSSYATAMYKIIIKPDKFKVPCFMVKYACLFKLHFMSLTPLNCC